MNNDFSKPQRQSIAGVVIMAAAYLYKIIKASIIPIILLLVKLQAEKLTYIFIAMGAILIIALFFSYLSYRKFTFFLDDAKQEFVINKGIFNRSLLTIQLDKIQQVNINQSLLQKTIGVYSLSIDTPGGENNEVMIQAIDEQIAYNLKEHLLNGQKISFGEPASLAENTPFFKLSAITLFKVGLTSNYGSSIALLAGFLFALFHNTKEILQAFDTDNGQVEEAIKTGFSVVSAGILTTIFLFLLLAINIIRTFVIYFDFNISKHKLSLLLSSGLLAKKNTLVSPNKVQMTRYSQNYFQKKFNIINLKLRQVGSENLNKDDDIPKSNLQIPGCSPAEKDELLMMILGKLPEPSNTYLPNYRFLNIPIILMAIIPTGIFYIFWFNFRELHNYYPLSIVYFLVTCCMIYFSYKRHRLLVDQEFIIKRSGIWDVSHEIIVPHKIQAITTFQYPWHKRADIGHINLHTAAGIIHFRYGNYTEIKRLANYWLYQVESGSDEWM
ncbi:PH domain-containing protein [Pedobacter insulae]|uniref:Putative membrane protein n=1 Tax=Pedobacter insulae TaxID=414048 RepID=A0A1I2UEZ7_9SPHI|nr:PH domain-containing protein [Pedobacter insulae]SFG75608.1 putative membrane protein [Pedobacter insulae]